MGSEETVNRDYEHDACSPFSIRYFPFGVYIVSEHFKRKRQTSLKNGNLMVSEHRKTQEVKNGED